MAPLDIHLYDRRNHFYETPCKWIYLYIYICEEQEETVHHRTGCGISSSILRSGNSRTLLIILQRSLSTLTSEECYYYKWNTKTTNIKQRGGGMSIRIVFIPVVSWKRFPQLPVYWVIYSVYLKSVHWKSNRFHETSCTCSFNLT